MELNEASWGSEASMLRGAVPVPVLFIELDTVKTPVRRHGKGPHEGALNGDVEERKKTYQKSWPAQYFKGLKSFKRKSSAGCR